MPLSVRKDLQTKENEVKVIREDLKKLGKQIEAFEQNYLEDTMYYGNVISGWTADGFEKAEEDKTKPRKMVDIPPELKIFSRERPFNSDKENEPEDAKRKLRKK